MIAVSLWDSATAMKQLQRLDDAITEATEIGLLEGWTVHCDECDVMRWINEDTHLPEPWFCPNCLATKDASLYGTRLKPSALAKTFLFKVVKSKVIHELAEIIMSMMSTCDSERAKEDDEDCEHVNIGCGTEVESNLVEDDALPYNLDAEVKKRMAEEEDFDEEIKEHKDEEEVSEKETVTQQMVEPCCPEAQSSLVEWPPIRGVAVEEIGMDVADVKPVKATMLEDLDIEWWLQHARCQKMSRKHRNGRRRNRSKATIVLLYQPARRKKMALEERGRPGKDITLDKCPWKRCSRSRKNRKIPRTRKVVKKVKQEVKCDEYSKRFVEFEFRKLDVWSWVLGGYWLGRLLVGEVIGWGTKSVLSCSMVRGQIVV